jgi:hypothetical protein
LNYKRLVTQAQPKLETLLRLFDKHLFRIKKLSFDPLTRQGRLGDTDGDLRVTIPGADSTNSGSDSLKASAGGSVDVDSGDDKKLFGIMSEFAESMSEERSSDTIQQPLPDTTPTNVELLTASTPLDMQPIASTGLPPQVGNDTHDFSVSRTDTQGNTLTVSARRLENGGFEGSVNVESKHANGVTASRSSARTFEMPTGSATNEYLTELFDPSGTLTYQLRRTEIPGEVTHLVEKLKGQEGAFSETTRFMPEA